MTNIPYVEILLVVNLIVMMVGFSLSSNNQLNISQMLKTIACRRASLENPTKKDTDNAS